MLPTRTFADFLRELQQFERASLPADAPKILDAFTRHSPYDGGALYLRDRDELMRLAATTKMLVAPEILDAKSRHEPPVEPRATVVIPLRGSRDDIGVLALTGRGSEEDLALVKFAAEYVSTMMTNQRRLVEAREGDFQLK